MRRITLLTLACIIAAAPSFALALKLSPLTLPIADNVAQPSIAANGDDGFILTWQRKHENGASLHYAQLDSMGQLQQQGLIAKSESAHPWFVNWADFPSLVVLDNGDWVTYWLQKRSPATYAYDVHLTRSTDHGKTWSESIVVHRDQTASEHGFVSLVPAGKDRVLAIWLDGRNTAPATSEHAHAHGDAAAAMTIRSAIVDRQGAISHEAEIDARTCDCCSTDAVRVAAETLMIYRDRSDDEIRDMHFSRRDRRGRWSAPALVHADGWKISGCPVNGPALAANAGRAFAIWTTMQGEVLSVRAALGAAKGFGRMIDIEQGERTMGRVDAARWGRSGFLASWVSGDAMQQSNAAGAPSSEVTSIRLIEVDARGKTVDRAILATLPKGANPGMPRIAASGRTAMAAWTVADGGSTSIKAVLIRP
jgi:hypothetical protein